MAQVPSLAKAARRVFDAFKQRRLAALDAAVRSAASFDDQPALAIAAVDLAARRKKLAAKIDVAALCATANVPPALYRSTHDDMLELCFPSWAAELKLANEKRREKDARPAVDADKKRKFDEGFAEFKSKVLNDAKPAASAAGKPKKQATLSAFVRRRTDDADDDAADDDAEAGAPVAGGAPVGDDDDDEAFAGHKPLRSRFVDDGDEVSD